MRVSRVSFGFTKNLGNFQSMRVDATVEVGEGENFDTALELASAVVFEALDMESEITPKALSELQYYRMKVQLDTEKRG